MISKSTTMDSEFEVRFRFLSEGGKRNITVIHKPSNIKITSPDYFINEKSDNELKKLVWEVMKKAIEIFRL
jgi:predicted secreted Zn-dependent protease